MAVEPDHDRRDGPGTSSTLLNGVIGAVAAAVLFFLPFSTVLGGAVAGYLEGGTLRDGATVGAVCGIVLLLPLLVVMALAVSVVGVFEPGAVGVAILVAFVLVLALGYVVALCVVGGVIGVYVREELDL